MPCDARIVVSHATTHAHLAPPLEGECANAPDIMCARDYYCKHLPPPYWDYE